MNKIEEEKKIKQIAIKKWTKLNIKNKWDNTFIYWQEKKREKRDAKKKIHQSPTTTPLHTCVAQPRRGRWRDYNDIIERNISPL